MVCRRLQAVWLSSNIMNFLILPLLILLSIISHIIFTGLILTAEFELTTMLGSFPVDFPFLPKISSLLLILCNYRSWFNQLFRFFHSIYWGIDINLNHKHGLIPKAISFKIIGRHTSDKDHTNCFLVNCQIKQSRFAFWKRWSIVKSNWLYFFHRQADLVLGGD